MNDKPDARTWRNPLSVENAGAERISRVSDTRARDLRRKAAAGCALGTFVIECPAPGHVAARWLSPASTSSCIDMEHSADRLLQPRAADRSPPTPPVSRRWCARGARTSGLIGKVLDIGANGIMAPHVESPERARAIVEQARFAPLGNRGFSPLTQVRRAERAACGARRCDLRRGRRSKGGSALEHVAEIAAVPGIDAVFVGPYDLALSLGVPPGSDRCLPRPKNSPRQRPATASRSASTSTTRRSVATGPRGASRCNA